MKKFTVGLLAGVILASATSVGAEAVTSIGKKITSVIKVTIDGKRLPADAIVVEGKSYVPLADIGQATNYEVKYVNNKDGIILTSQPVSPVVEEESLQTQLEKLQNEISATELRQVEVSKIYFYNQMSLNDPSAPESIKDSLKQEVTKYDKQREEVNTKLKELRAKLVVLEEKIQLETTAAGGKLKE